MTRAQIEKELLDLPEGDRAAVAIRLVGTLSEGLQALIRRQMDSLRLEELDSVGDRLEAQMLSWFEGPKAEVTDEVWAEIRKADPADLDPNSWAIPPGFKPRFHRSQTSPSVRRIIITAAALNDLKNSYIWGVETHGRQQTDAYLEGFRSKLEILRELPGIGAP